MDKETYYQMLDAYYALHGGDRKTGLPKRETLLDLGLKYVARDLEKIGKIRHLRSAQGAGLQEASKKVGEDSRNGFDWQKNFEKAS